MWLWNEMQEERPPMQTSSPMMIDEWNQLQLIPPGVSQIAVIRYEQMHGSSGSSLNRTG
jgi:hypothetical protein